MEFIWNHPPGPTRPLLFGFDITHFHLGIFGAMPERMRSVPSSSSRWYNLYFFRKIKIEKLPHLGIVIPPPLSSSPPHHLPDPPPFALLLHPSRTQTWSCCKVNRFSFSRGQQADRLKVRRRSYTLRRCYCVSQPDSVCLCLHVRVRKGGKKLQERDWDNAAHTQFPYPSDAWVDQMFLSLAQAARPE